MMGEDRRDVGLLAITSADRLHAGLTAACAAREAGDARAAAHVERLLDAVPPGCGLVTVLDGHPATLGWLGAVAGLRTRGARRHPLRPRPAPSPTSTGTTASMPPASSVPPKLWRRGGRSATCARSREGTAGRPAAA